MRSLIFRTTTRVSHVNKNFCHVPGERVYTKRVAAGVTGADREAKNQFHQHTHAQRFPRRTSPTPPHDQFHLCASTAGWSGVRGTSAIAFLVTHASMPSPTCGTAGCTSGIKYKVSVPPLLNNAGVFGNISLDILFSGTWEACVGGCFLWL